MRKSFTFFWLSAMLMVATAKAGQPQFKTLRLAVDQYITVTNQVPNAAITVYKSISLGTVYSPWKPTAIFVSTRTNIILTLLPGTYRFRMTATVQPYGESLPGNIITYTISP